MQLTPRAKVVAYVAVVAVAVALAAVASGRGCTPVDATPEGTARAFVSAARSGDRPAVWALLGPATQARLTAAAQGATDRVGGTRRYAALDMLTVGGGAGSWVPSGYAVLPGGSPTSARVEVRGPAGQRTVLELTQVAGRWRVELGALPAGLR